MKNRIIKILVVVGIMIIVGCLIRFGTKIYEERKYINELIDALNNDVMYDFITEDEMYIHNYAKSEVPSEFNITPAIDVYIDNICICIENKIHNSKKNYKVINAMLVGDDMVINGFKDRTEFDFVQDIITNEDIENYLNGMFKDNFIKKLKPIIKNKIENGKINWYVDNDYNKTIELPYNIYADFIYSDKKNNDIKRIKDIKFLNKNYSKCQVQYEDSVGRTHKNDIVVVTKTVDGKNRCSISSFNSIYYEMTQQSHLTFGQHDYDKEREEWRKMVDEMSYAQNRDLLDDKYIEIPQFKKYKADSTLEVKTFDDGIEIYFTSAKRLLDDKERGKEYKQYQLFYDDVKTPEEALERYLKDEEHFKADEEFLKINNRFYNGD